MLNAATIADAAAPANAIRFGFSAGAMLFIISDEIIPETHRGGLQSRRPSRCSADSRS